MTSRRITGARTTVAVAATALLLVAGCDDGTDPSAPPESPAEQGTETGGDESTGTDKEAPADEASGGEESTAAPEDSGTEDEQDNGGEEESGDASAGEISGDPCADLSSEDVGAVLGNEVGERENEANQGLPEGADGESLVVCNYNADTVDVPSAALYWMMPFDDYPDEMPEDIREEQNEARASGLLGDDGEEIDVAGASQATVEISTSGQITQIILTAVVGDAVLNSSLYTEAGALDESDIPTAVELAELAISKA